MAWHGRHFIQENENESCPAGLYGPLFDHRVSNVRLFDDKVWESGAEEGTDIQTDIRDLCKGGVVVDLRGGSRYTISRATLKLSPVMIARPSGSEQGCLYPCARVYRLIQTKTFPVNQSRASPVGREHAR